MTEPAAGTGENFDAAQSTVPPAARSVFRANVDRAVEYAELLASAGLKLSRVVPTRSPFSIIEAVRA